MASIQGVSSVDLEYKCVVGQTYIIDIAPSRAKFYTQEAGNNLSVDATPYKGAETSIALTKDTLVQFRGLKGVLANPNEIIDLKENLEAEIVVGLIPKTGHRISQEYTIPATYLPCMQGDAEDRFIEAHIDFMTLERAALIREHGISTLNQGKNQSWYDVWLSHRKAVSEKNIYPIRCNRAELLRCLGKVVDDLDVLKGPNNQLVSPIIEYKEHLSGVQICLMGRSGLGFSQAQGDYIPHCRINNKQNQRAWKADFTRCHYSLFDSLTAIGVTPITKTYFKGVLDRTCNRDWKRLTKKLETTARWVVQWLPTAPKSDEHKLDTFVQRQAQDLYDRLDQAKLYRTPRYCTPNFENLIKFFASDVNSELPQFQDKFRSYEELDCSKTNQLKAPYTVLCDVSTLYRWAAKFSTQKRKSYAKRSILYQGCKSPWNAYQFSKRPDVGGGSSTQSITPTTTSTDSFWDSNTTSPNNDLNDQLKDLSDQTTTINSNNSNTTNGTNNLDQFNSLFDSDTQNNSNTNGTNQNSTIKSNTNQNTNPTTNTNSNSILNNSTTNPAIPSTTNTGTTNQNNSTNSLQDLENTYQGGPGVDDPVKEAEEWFK